MEDKERKCEERRIKESNKEVLLYFLTLVKIGIEETGTVSEVQ